MVRVLTEVLKCENVGLFGTETEYRKVNLTENETTVMYVGSFPLYGGTH